MANSITLAQKYLGVLDAIYKETSLTARLDAQTQVDFSGGNVVKVAKTSMVGLGNYSRATGYPAGDVTLTWETMTLATDRARSMSVDRMDNEETLEQAFGTLAGEFMRTVVSPEIDAYRFAKYASWSGISTVAEAVLSTAALTIAAFDVAMNQLDADEVPQEGRICYMATPIHQLLRAAITRTLANEPTADRRLNSLDDVVLVKVPQARFYTQVTLDAGATSSAGGFTKTASTGRDINFLLLHPTAILQVNKHADMKVFPPEVNQTADAWLVQYRQYHDAFVYENKVKGVYLHKKTS